MKIEDDVRTKSLGNLGVSQSVNQDGEEASVRRVEEIRSAILGIFGFYHNFVDLETKVLENLAQRNFPTLENYGISCRMCAEKLVFDTVQGACRKVLNSPRLAWVIEHFHHIFPQKEQDLFQAFFAPKMSKKSDEDESVDLITLIPIRKFNRPKKTEPLKEVNLGRLFNFVRRTAFNRLQDIIDSETRTLQESNGNRFVDSEDAVIVDKQGLNFSLNRKEREKEFNRLVKNQNEEMQNFIELQIEEVSMQTIMYELGISQHRYYKLKNKMNKIFKDNKNLFVPLA